MRLARSKKPSRLLDMSPLIDCVFLLLIFFMLSSSFLSPMIKISLPKAATTDQPLPDEVVVSCDASGKIFVNRDRIEMETLLPRLQDLLAGSEKKTVTFRGDEAIPYRIFVEVMDAARRAGAAHFHIAHELPREETGGP